MEIELPTQGLEDLAALIVDIEAALSTGTRPKPEAYAQMAAQLRQAENAQQGNAGEAASGITVQLRQVENVQQENAGEAASGMAEAGKGNTALPDQGAPGQESPPYSGKVAASPAMADRAIPSSQIGLPKAPEMGISASSQNSGPVPGRPEFENLAQLNAQVAGCEACALCLNRNHAVPGMGVSEPLVLVVGEGPGADEDRQGLPFVGAAGRYLDSWLAAIGMSRQEDVYITNLVKCRPPGNRDPLPEEILACSHYLEAQIKLLNPKFILALGRVSSQYFLGEAQPMHKIHGQIFQYKGRPVLPTYHPAAVLRDPQLRKPVWNDLQVLHSRLFSQGFLGPLPDKASR